MTQTSDPFAPTLEVAIDALTAINERPKVDPLDHLGRLVYSNRHIGGDGYDPFGQSDIDRAQEVLDIVDGNVEIAERVITRLYVT